MSLSIIIFAAVLTTVLAIGGWGWQMSFQAGEPAKVENAQNGMNVTDPWDVQIMLDLFILVILGGIHILHTPPIF